MGSQFFFQTTTQSLAHRLWRYATAARGTSFYPASDDFFTDAVEVGPCTARDGPCIVHFSGCQLSAEEVNAWILSGTSSSANIVRHYWMGPSPSEAASLEELLAAVLAAGPAPDGGPLRLQCFPRTLERWLGDQLPASFNLQPVDPAWVLNIVCLTAQEKQGEQAQAQSAAGDPAAASAAGDTAAAAVQQQGPAAASQEQQQQQPAAGEQPPPAQQQQQQQQQGEPQVPPHSRQRILFSLQPASTLYNYSPVRCKRIDGQLSKAAGKLAEALQATGVQLTSGVAVDLGAAPGGWTHVLAQHAQRVIAVDPAAMDERALASGVVTHLACKAEDAVAAIQEIVRDRGIAVLVSDMNRHPSTIVGMMRPLLPLLHPGAAVILTLKFFGKGAGREEEWQQLIAEELGTDFERVQMVWLLANTTHEQTCIAFKKADAAASAAVVGPGCTADGDAQ